MKLRTVRKAGLSKKAVAFAVLPVALLTATLQAEPPRNNPAQIVSLPAQTISGKVVAIKGPTFTLKIEHPLQFEDATGNLRTIHRGAKVRITAVDGLPSTSPVSLQSANSSQNLAVPEVQITAQIPHAANSAMRRALAVACVGGHITFEGPLIGTSIHLTRLVISNHPPQPQPAMSTVHG